MPPSGVTIIGGGVSGLAAAYELAVRGVPCTLLERNARCGGVVLTEAIDGYTIDAGPDALLTQKPAAIELCRSLGLAERLRAPMARETYVVRRGGLRRLPDASVFGIPTEWAPFASTRAFSWWGKLRIAAEALLPARRSVGDESDESIGAFIRRRFGREAVDYLAEPLLAGIHGGDPATLSMRASFPRFLDFEARHGSVIAGLRSAVARPAAPSRSNGPFVALRGGMQELTDALRSALPDHYIRTGLGVDVIEPRGRGYVLHLTNGACLPSPIVIVATPPPVTSRLLDEVDGDAATLAAGIRMTSTVTVALAFSRGSVGHPLNGTGFVVPRREGLRIRAASWVSSKWAGRAPDGHVLLRAYLGGALDPGAIDLDDNALVSTVHADMTALLAIVGEPQLARVYRWPNATPQLEVGHLALMDQIDQRLEAHPGLFVTASGFRGTGIADCVADAQRQAARAATVWCRYTTTDPPSLRNQSAELRPASQTTSVRDDETMIVA